jgi:uncharacterized protein
MFPSTLNLMFILVVGIATTAWQQWSFPAMIYSVMSQSSQQELATSARFRVTDDKSFVNQLTLAALNRAGLVVRYDPSYRKISFPRGDVPSNVGGAADEIVRAYREVGVDLQERVYIDMTNSFGAYPQVKDKRQPDTNIDHRLVPNLQVFFKRNAMSLSTARTVDDYVPGDIITCTLPGGEPHIALVVPAPGDGRPWILHNTGFGPRLEDKLFESPLTGHYRYRPRG